MLSYTLTKIYDLRGDNLFNIVGTMMTLTLAVLFLSVLVFGLIQCKKHNFTAGIYFFIIMIVLYIAPYLYNPLLNHYFQSVYYDSNLPFGLSFGQFITFFNMIPQTIEFIAFVILVIGLYRMWKTKAAKD